MNPTALPSTTLQRDFYGGFQTLVGLRNDQVNTGEATIGLIKQELRPARFGFAVPHINTQDFGGG